VTIFLVRHAKAGSRSHWDGTDIERPLEADGFWQAEQIAEALLERAGGLITSSPYVRCIQTVEPLAARRGVKVIELTSLRENSSVAGVLDLLAVVPDGSVMCSHGDVIPDTINALVWRGMTIHGSPDTRKGSVWELERSGTEIISARATPPPRR
jgi:8-oxo-dGTP diphosphatase